MWAAIKRLELWLNAYPGAADVLVLRFMHRNQFDILELMPSSESKSHQSIKNQFLDLIQEIKQTS